MKQADEFEAAKTSSWALASEALFMARHRLSKEGFGPDDPTIKAINDGIAALSAQHSDLADELRRLLIDYRADPHGRRAFEIAQLFELNADTILTALRSNRAAIDFQPGELVEYTNREVGQAFRAKVIRMVEGWVEIEFPDHSDLNPSRAIVRPSRVSARSLNGGDQYGGMEDAYRAEWKDTINQPQESDHG